MKVFDMIDEFEKSGSISKEAAERIKQTAIRIRSVVLKAQPETEYEKIANAVPDIRRISMTMVMDKMASLKYQGIDVSKDPGATGRAILRLLGEQDKTAAPGPAEVPSGNLTGGDQPQTQQQATPSQAVAQETNEGQVKAPQQTDIQDVSKVRDKLIATYPPLAKYDPTMVDEHIRNVLSTAPSAVVDNPEATAKAIERAVLSQAASSPAAPHNPGGPIAAKGTPTTPPGVAVPKPQAVQPQATPTNQQPS